MARSDFSGGFLDRTAGLEEFLRRQQEQPSGQAPAPTVAPNLVQMAQQPAQPDTPFRESFLGGMTSLLVPGAARIFQGQEQKEQQAELANIIKDPQLSREQKTSALAQLSLPAAQKFASLQPTTGKPSENEKQVQILMDRGINQADAENIANGFLKPVPNPVTGVTELVDLTTGQTKPLTIQSPTAPAPAPTTTEPTQIEQPKVPSLFDRADLATGAASSFKAGLSGITGQLGLPIAEETIQARQDLKTAGQSLVRSLIEDRFTAAQMKEIKKEVDIEPSAFDSGKSLRQRMISIDRSLRNRLAKQEKAANDTSLPAKTRQESATNANAIKGFLDTLKVPVQVKSVEDARKLPSGTRFIDPKGVERIVP